MRPIFVISILDTTRKGEDLFTIFVRTVERMPTNVTYLLILESKNLFILLKNTSICVYIHVLVYERSPDATFGIDA